MEIEARTEILKIIETLTHSGDPSLDEKLMKKIKNYCRTNNTYVQLVYDRLMRDVATKHSEVRLSSFQIIDQLFQRSHIFRQLVTSDCQKLIMLVCGVEPLPPPRLAAAKLKEVSLLSFKEWVEKYGEGYPKLKLGYNYLKHNKKVDFDRLTSSSEGEQRRQEERESRQRAFLEQRLEKIRVEMNEQAPDIKGCLFEMESCFKILMPSFMDLFPLNESNPVSNCSQNSTKSDSVSAETDSELVLKTVGSPSSNETSSQTGGCSREPDDTSTDGESESDDVEWEEVTMATGAINGLVGRNPTVTTIRVPDRVIVNKDDNETLIATLRERYKLAVKTYLPRINKWIEWFTKAGQEALLKEAIDLKAQVLAAKGKYAELDIKGLEQEEEEDSSTGPTDLAPPSYPPDSIAAHCSSLLPWTTAVASYHKTPVGLEEDLASDPTTPQAQMKAKGLLQQQSATIPPGPAKGAASGSSQTSSAATVPFDVDLLHWGDSRQPSIMPTAMDSLHRYWCAEPDLTVSEDVMASLSHRSITFAGTFQPVERSCRAPLPSGSLCPRKDKIKCPLHGVIIPRDEHGDPIDCLEMSQSDTVIETKTPAAAAPPDTPKGGTKDKKPRSKKTKYPGLTDIKKLEKTPKNRIESKILNKHVLARVGKKLDALDQKRGKTKFSDNFNYALKS
ncbi:PREDICTED: UV-stimulated scaffold protein A-like isoform X2 [Amphimedon queenslandica]|uniref:UV-stimulated scaffold protein A C-terminal domain-containing protein n=1 Tax=Amphimedon queenslandica TaxID=400682 RepID=A0AAN0IXB5_AMPQE|nr:PREDICTED: UV-stimulated scaffold protein A-like isoform X2 [Amphimedon queenslandica]|eukprot:XP_019849405.1 PREDICTED: UV-stimulated scaffold protein A-like isoform X2 [Amphimedon queenslandica]